MNVPRQAEIEREFADFWRGIVCQDGVLDMAQAKRELYDYSCVMREVSKVYDALTHGRISKVTTAAVAVLSEIEAIQGGCTVTLDDKSHAILERLAEQDKLGVDEEVYWMIREEVLRRADRDNEVEP